jgi:hypothetical protein
MEMVKVQFPRQKSLVNGDWPDRLSECSYRLSGDDI